MTFSWIGRPRGSVPVSVRFVSAPLKSPLRYASVGTVFSDPSDAMSFRNSSQLMKKKVRLRPLYTFGTQMGPLSENPKSCFRLMGLVLVNGLDASSASLLKYSYRLP